MTLLFVIAFVLGTTSSDWFRGSKAPFSGTDPFWTVAQTNTLSADEQSNISIYNKALPATVSITSTVLQRNWFFEPYPAAESGTGFLIDAEGRILTNHHVIAGDAPQIEVTLASGQGSDEEPLRFKAEVLAADEINDLALIKIESDRPLPFLPLGDSEHLQVGQKVLAIGNPFGLSGSLTTGVISSLGRSIQSEGGVLEDMIQTDAAINPGNSGGALINTRGELVGINTAILSRSGGTQGVGFAVPVNLAHHVTKQLVEHGRVERGFMGVGIQDISPAMEKTLDTPDSHGAVVTNVTADSPAAKAGLEQYDVIRSVDGQKIRDARELRLAVANHAPGDTVEVAVLRDGAAKTMNVTLGEFPNDGNGETSEEHSPTSGALEGVSVDNLSPQVAEQLGLDSDIKGVVVTRVRPDSPAAEAGLQSGLVIQEVNRKPVNNVDEFRSAMGTVKKGEAVMLLVHVRGGSRFVVVEP
ncbi:MAG: Do family serine endopeptidase [Bryobacterales bacterium]